MSTAQVHHQDRKKATDRDHVRYVRILDRMGDKIPKTRRTSDPENVRWFLRQGAVLVMDSTDLNEAISLGQKILNSHQ